MQTFESLICALLNLAAVSFQGHPYTWCTTVCHVCWLFQILGQGLL